jgi:hypothetical protein
MKLNLNRKRIFKSIYHDFLATNKKELTKLFKNSNRKKYYKQIRAIEALKKKKIKYYLEHTSICS